MPDQLLGDDELEGILGRPEPLSASWVLRPTLRATLFPQTLSYAKFPKIGRPGNALALAAINGSVGRTGDPYEGAKFIVDDSNRLWMWNTTNQRRAFGKFVEGTENISPTLRSNRSFTARSLVDLPARLGRAIAARQANIIDERQVIGFTEAWTKHAELLLQRASGILEATRPSTVVIANQHSAIHRAVISVARSSGIPTVYLPHAPMAANRQYADLPVDYASAFGSGEVEVLGSLGADISRIRVCGNPGLKVLPGSFQGSSKPHQLRIVAAPSPVSTELLQWFFSKIRSAHGDDFDVCLHPRLKSRSMKPMVGSDTNVVVGTRTADYIRSTNCIVIHMNSGVGLEAQALGVPAINLIRPEMSPSYHYLRDHHAITAHGDFELKQAIQKAATALESGQSEKSASEFEWLGPTGEQAEVEIGKLLSSSTVQVAPILDGWS